MKKLKKAELEHQQSHTKRLLNKIKDLRMQRDILETEQTRKQLEFLRLKFFEHANKPGRWIANRLRQESAKKTISKVKDESGEHQREKDIQQFFVKKNSKYFHCPLFLPDIDFEKV